jgi:D-alanyl-D-alanine carboxypeptidase
LRTVDGVDGIKTGYTEASGYNLISSTRRGARRIVAVILGERSNGARDTRMRGLIEQHIVRASNERTAPEIVEREDIGTEVAVLPAANFSLQSAAPAEEPTPVPAVVVAPAVPAARAAPASFQAVP